MDTDDDHRQIIIILHHDPASCLLVFVMENSSSDSFGNIIKMRHLERGSVTSSTLTSSTSTTSSSSSSTSSSSTSSWLSISASPPPLALTTTFITILLACLLLLSDPSIQIHFAPKLITRFCYNSPNLSTVNSQCVLCNYYMFDATVLGCTGSTALTMNITSTQAFCVISQCLGQIRQQPVFLGRRRKRENGKQQEENEWDVTQLNNSTGSNEFRIAQEVNADVYDPYDPSEDEKYGPEE